MITKERILSSTSIREFSKLCSSFECNECSLREEAWVLNYHQHPIPNDYHLRSKDKYDLVFIGSHLQPRDGYHGAAFTSESGMLIRGIFEESLEQVNVEVNYIFMNVAMCQTEDDRRLEKDEIEACSPFMYKQLSLLNPNCIVLLGSVASKKVLNLKNNVSLKSIIGKDFNIKLFNKVKNIPALVAYHPSYFIKRPSLNPEEHYQSIFKKAIDLSRRYKI